MARMTYEEFEKMTMEDLRRTFHHDYDKDYPDKVLANGCIKVAYEEALAYARRTGDEKLSCSGFVHSCYMLWDDLPTTYDEYKASEAEFQKKQQTELAAAFWIQ